MTDESDSRTKPSRRQKLLVRTLIELIVLVLIFGGPFYWGRSGH